MFSLFKLFLFSCLICILNSCKITPDETEIAQYKELSRNTEVVQLNMIGHWWDEGKREDLLRETANEFEFLNQGIKVNYKFPEEVYGGSDSLERDLIIKQTKMATAEWDIVRIKEHYPVISRSLNDPNWGSKYLVDFTKVEGFTETHLNTLNLQAQMKRTGNICVGPYNEGFYWALYVNSDVAKKIGINVKQYDMTFDDFLGYIKAVYEYNKANRTSVIPIFEDKNWISTETIFSRLCFSLMDNYDEIASDKFSNKKIDAIVRTYNDFEQLARYGAVRKDRSKLVWTRDNIYPLRDSCLFFVNGSWMYNIWHKKDKVAMRKMIPCELPVYKSSDTYIGGYTSNWAVMNNAPHKEAAIKFMLYWCRPEMSEKWVRYTKCPTGIKGNLVSNTFGLDVFEDFQFNIDKKYGSKRVAATDFTLLVGAENFNVKLNVIDVLQGTMTADEAIKILKKSIVK